LPATVTLVGKRLLEEPNICPPMLISGCRGPRKAQVADTTPETFFELYVASQFQPPDHPVYTGLVNSTL
jgi:hypothetical protein